ncbi:uncharacterized protein PSFLO_03735 [Pseudozyma flocculosa]|uniref:Uncharacterized protein n=1 Tax=Pseudozyma flocculosa TaxID=84751 RepID=A0A5C3F1F6_9BASI|nr:uncharacterized protein PSFLO_03735 [Pseudozyma flocculosa]
MQTKTYAVALAVLLLATVLEAWSIWTPTWIRASTPASSPIHYSARYGLTQRCERAYLDLPSSSGLSGSHAQAHDQGWKCRSFPLSDRDCSQDRNFCAAWRGASYAAQMSFAFLVVSLLGLLLILLLNGRQRKRDGWRIISGCSALALTLQAIAVGVIANLFNNDERFYAGSKLVGLVAGGIRSGQSDHGPQGDGYRSID